MDFNFLKGLEQPVPRYTSYPTVPEWHQSDESDYLKALQTIKKTDPLSLYFHIPFCRSMCLYCGCSVILNRNPAIEYNYIDSLRKEIHLIRSILTGVPTVTQIHFGGGTPSGLQCQSLIKLFKHIQEAFIIAPDNEINMEVDPRTVIDDSGAFLQLLKNLGFNRISLGIQDTNHRVQEAVKRKQTYYQSKYAYDLCRKLDFESINFDLIYGLPFQTSNSFSETLDLILQMRPDRIALFSYAKVPWLKKHQQAIKDDWLPSMEEKFRIYSRSRDRLIQAGYIAIGMDHFALPKDSLAISYLNKTLIRNFQGYSLPLADNLIGFGISSTGFINNTYVQNTKSLASYDEYLQIDRLPIAKTFILSPEDTLRKWVIHRLMCQFEIEKSEFQTSFGTPFDDHFVQIRRKLIEMESVGLLKNTCDRLFVTPLGELFVRVIATAFDDYLANKTNNTPIFSQSI
ncbi:MAG: oxygen-independent coproporphyrinogen III oxidase [Victivallaceae bacterium]